MFFKEPEITSCDVKQNISQLQTKKQFNYNVTCIRNADVTRADAILIEFNV